MPTKKLTVAFCLMLVVTAGLRADDHLRQVQQALKDQGFYYGIVDGEEGSETNAAVRRYQIRNSLEVTGKLNEQTLNALKMGKAEEPAAAAPTEETSEPAPTAPPPVVENDKNFLRKQAPP